MKKLAALLCTILLTLAAVAQNNISVPAGTALRVKLETTLSTFSNKEGDPVSGKVMEAVTLGGKTVIPEKGSPSLFENVLRVVSNLTRNAVPAGTEMLFCATAASVS